MLLLASLALISLPDVLTVDANPAAGADFTDLSQAIFAAQDGDTVVVANGTYTATGSMFNVQAKSLELIGRPGPRPRLFSGLAVRDLAADQRVTVRGFIVRQGDGCDSLLVEDCDGTVWVENVRMKPLPSVTCSGTLIRAFRAASLVLVDADLNSPDVDLPAFAPLALRTEASMVYAHDLTFEPLWPGKGTLSPSVRLLNSDLVLQGGRVVGASGEPGDPGAPFGADCAEDGSAAVEVSGPGSSLSAFGAELEGGAAGPNDPCASAVGAPAVDNAGTVDLQSAAPVRTMAFDALGESGSTLPIEFAGEPGEFVTLGVSFDAAPILLPDFFGTLALSLPATLFPVGTTAADGTLSFAPVLPTLPPGTPARSFDAQALWNLPNGTAALGQPRHLTVVEVGL